MDKKQLIAFDYETSIETKTGFFFDVIVSGSASVYQDDFYGADADGNRGVTRYFCDDLEIDFIVRKNRKNNFNFLKLRK